MKGGILAAWLAGEAIVIWRIVHRDHSLPAPGALLGITALFLAGAFVADVYPRASPLIVASLAGLDVAALFNALPAGLAGQISEAQAAEAATSGGSGPASSVNRPVAPATEGG